jgi:hypothetical protein
MRSFPQNPTPGKNQRGMIGVLALVILGVLATLGMALLTASQGDRFTSTRTRNRAEAFYVAEGGLQATINTLKTNATNVVRATFPVMPGFLTNAADWGFTPANYPSGLVFNNMPGGQFIANDPTSNVVATIPSIGRGNARVTVWLRSVGATLADPVVFGVTSLGTLDGNLTARTVQADVTLVARGGRPPNPLQSGGLEGPVLNLLVDGDTSISGTVLDGGATVRVLKRVGNNWSLVGTTNAANGGGSSYAFSLNVSSPLTRGETYSAISQATHNGPWSPLAFPSVVE